MQPTAGALEPAGPRPKGQPGARGRLRRALALGWADPRIPKLAGGLRNGLRVRCRGPAGLGHHRIHRCLTKEKRSAPFGRAAQYRYQDAHER